MAKTAFLATSLTLRQTIAFSQQCPTTTAQSRTTTNFAMTSSSTEQQAIGKTGGLGIDYPELVV